MNEQDILYTIALTLLPGLSKGALFQMCQEAGSAQEVYELFRQPEHDETPDKRLSQLMRQLPLYLDRAQREYAFTQERGITCLTWTDSRYPQRLLECEDAPPILYYNGSADLNNRHILAMVGTRRCTEYGRDLCRIFLRDLAQLCPDALVISGLAYGIDVNAHQQALDNKLQTVGVLAHGLDQIYPSSHKYIANRMIEQGGLLTEFISGSNADKFHFVQRNRIVAGMADCCVVVESKKQGGSLITAELANDYHRDVFACPGRVTDELSQGCNALIQENKAMLLQDAEQFVEVMGWQKQKARAVQQELFVDLTPEEEKIVTILRKVDALNVNTLAVQCGVPVHQLHVLLLGLEMKGVVKQLVGNQYRILR